MRIEVMRNPAKTKTDLQGAIEGMLIRGGTSNGLFVHKDDLPASGELLDELLLEIYGTPDPLQINGLGGSKSHTSKFMSVSPPTKDGIDAEYTFAQIGIDEATVDWSSNCGNLTSAIGPFAMYKGIIEPKEPTTTAKLYNTNTDKVITQEIPVRDGEPDVYGDYKIDGVPGTGGKVTSQFPDPAGSRTGALLPTGDPVNTVTIENEEIEVSIVDSTNLVVFVRAEDMRMEGTEIPSEMESDIELMDRFEKIRSAAASLTENGEVPSPAVVTEPMSYECSVDRTVSEKEINITSRIITLQPHHAYSMTGAMCLGTATHVPGTIPHRVAELDADEDTTIGHPKGTVTVGPDVQQKENGIQVKSVTNYRTVRPIFNGEVYFRYQQGLESLKPSGKNRLG